MALTQEQVDWWFSQNPNATADQVAEAVKGAGGLEANAGLADMIANRYAIDTSQVTDYYNNYAPVTSGLSNVTTTDTGGNTGADTTSNVTTTGGGLSNLTSDTTSSLGATTDSTNVSTTDATNQFKPVDLGNGTFRTYGGTIIDANGFPVTSATTVATSDWPTITYGTTGTDGDVETRTTTSDGTPFYLRDEDGGGMYQNPATVESYAPFTGADGKTYYNVYAPVFSSGKEWNETPITKILTEDQFKALQGGSTFGDAVMGVVNSPVGSFALGVLGPYGQAFNAVNQARQGNYLGAAVSGLTAAGGFGVTDIGGIDIKTATNVARGLNAIDKNDLAGAFTAGANLMGGVPSQYTTATNLASAGLALKNNDTAGFISALGDLTGSKDAKIAAAAIRLQDALSSNTLNPIALQSAFNNLGSAVNGSVNTQGGLPTTTGTTKVADSVPLTESEIADLNEDQLRVYNESGVSGLRDYNRAIKNLTSLTTSGLTGDSMGGGDTTTGTTTGGLTGTTRSLTGTGALSTATTTDQFEDLLITSLRGQGLNNAQISTYLENLNSQSSGLSDVGLLAFRQAKITGATDAEALAAANLASGKTSVVTDTGTEAELVVTDTDFETDTYSFYDTQREFETSTELVITSGRETGQVTESGTETDSGILITDVIDTTLTRGLTPVVNKETETETGTEEEVVVTTASETETETITEIIVTTSSETESETETITEIIVTTASETKTESETITEIIVTTSSETESESESETITEIIVTTSSETESESESETITEIIVTTSSETLTDTLTDTLTETETITEIIITDTRTESETETETVTKIVTTPVITKPPTVTSGSFTAGTPAAGIRGKPNEFLKENLLKTYMTKDSFKDPLAQFNKIRQDMAKDQMMQQGVDPRLAAILAAKMNGEEAPPKKTYNYGEEPDSIDDILSLKGEGDQNYAQGGYVQPLITRGGLSAMHKGREDFRDGKHVAGEGDGQSDDIPAMLADGEFVFPADVVSALGNGSTKAGTDKLYEMMHSIRDRARSKGRKDLPPPALKSPLDYLKKR